MPTPIPDAHWYCKPIGAYDRTSTEAYENAICAYNLLHSLGWSCQAVAAFWGNVEAESGYNPWRWQADYEFGIPSSNQYTERGYGLVQFTPAAKYIHDERAQINVGYGPNFSDWEGNIFDGDSQIRFINDYADYSPNPGYNYQIEYSDFKTGEYTPEYLAKAWLHNYERPLIQTEPVENYRAYVARYWYDILIEFDPSDPIPPEPGGGEPTPKPIDYATVEKFKISFYLKPHYKKY